MCIHGHKKIGVDLVGYLIYHGFGKFYLKHPVNESEEFNFKYDFTLSINTGVPLSVFKDYTGIERQKRISIIKTIALYDICGKIPNLALMKLSAYYKDRGYRPVLCKDKPLPGAKLHYDSSVFHHPRANLTLALLRDRLGDDIITGSSRVDLKRKLPPEIDRCFPDYSLYRWGRYVSPTWSTSPKR